MSVPRVGRKRGRKSQPGFNEAADGVGSLSRAPGVLRGCWGWWLKGSAPCGSCQAPTRRFGAKVHMWRHLEKLRGLRHSS